MSEYLEVPRPRQLLRTAGWNVVESFGFPVAGYAIAAWLAGRTAGLGVMLAVIWITAGIRRLVTGRVPSLVTISLVVLTIQTAIAIATGNLWIFLVHFPIANFGLCILFARTARGHSPLAARLAAEVIGLDCSAAQQPRLHHFFQHVTMLWASIFLLLAATLAALLATIPLTTYVLVWAVTTITLLAAGIGVSVWWFRSELRKLSIGVRFGDRASVR